jgi:diketogulonate reductase-like aldo/keto reductase
MLDYPGPDDESVRGQWKALEEMRDQKLTRTIAVSNFSPAQLDVCATNGGTVPTVNQLPYGVGFSSYYGGKAASIVEANHKRGVVIQAWSPLRRALKGKAGEACASIGKKYGKSAAQVGLRWIVDTGGTFTTQTQSASHFKEDLDIFDFQLTKDEVAILASL